MKLIWYIVLLNAQVLYISAEYVTVCSDWHHHARIKCPGDSVILVSSVYRYDRTTRTCEVPESSTDSCKLREDTRIESNEEEASRSVFYRCQGNRECLIEPEDANRTLDCGTTDLLHIRYICYTVTADDIVLSTSITEWTEENWGFRKEIFSPNYPCGIPADVESIHCHIDVISREADYLYIFMDLNWRLISFPPGDEDCSERIQVNSTTQGTEQLRNTCSIQNRPNIFVAESDRTRIRENQASNGSIPVFDIYYKKTTMEPGGKFWLQLSSHSPFLPGPQTLTCDIKTDQSEETKPGKGTMQDPCSRPDTCQPFIIGSTTAPSAVTVTTDRVTTLVSNDIQSSAVRSDSSDDDSSVIGVATGLTVIIVILLVVIGILIWRLRKALHTPPDVQTESTSKLDKDIPLSPRAPSQEYEELDKTTREPTPERDNQGYVNTVAPVYVNVQEESKYEDVETNEDNQQYEPVRQQPR